MSTVSVDDGKMESNIWAICKYKSPNLIDVSIWKGGETSMRSNHLLKISFTESTYMTFVHIMNTPTPNHFPY